MKANSKGVVVKGKPVKKKKSKALLIFVCIFLAVVIVVTAVFGIIALVRRNNAVARYGSYMVDEGEAVYLASYFKYRFLSGLSDSGIDSYDTEWFWESESEGEGTKTYGELLREGFEEYISGILVANALFDKYSSLEKADKEKIKTIKERAIENYGSEEKFNEAAAVYGFDYDDYSGAVELLYKATMAQIVIFGTNGEKLSSFPEECADFFGENYSRVSLLFLRDEEILVKNEDGSTTLRPITDEERAEREGYAERLRTTIYNRQNGIDGEKITPEMFEYYYKKSDSDLDMYRNYYLAESAESTVELATAFPEVVDAALSMQVGDYKEVECSIGVCFIYKEALEDNAYTDKNNLFFSDFYSDAIYSVYSEMLALYAPDVIFADKFYGIDVVSIPKNYKFIISVTQ